MIPLVNKPDQFVWAMPYGKPDGTLPLVDRHNDTRPRVAQSAQKGDECWYEALNRIRTRIGKGSTDKTFSEDRKFERLMSGYRKSLAELSQTKELLADYVKVILKKIQQQSSPVPFPPTMIMQIIEELLQEKMLNAQARQTMLSFFESNPSPINSDTAKSCFEQFCIFLERDYIKNRCVHAKKFIEEKLGRSPKDVVRTFVGFTILKHSFVLPPEKIETVIDSILSEHSSKMSCLLQAGILHACYQNYHLERSTWTPSEPIEKLLEELKAHGPLAVAGKMGLPFYKKPPYQLREPIGGQTVWGWTKGDYDSEITYQHAIIVIGAENLAQKTIVFIDPNDRSDPNQKDLQRIYRMSYERFVSSIQDFWNGGLDRSLSSFADRGYLIYSKDFRPLS